MKHLCKLDTKIVKIDSDNIDYEILKEAAEIIKKGGLVVFPTETVYGLGADAFNDDACDKIFAAKGRPQDNPLIVHIHEVDSLKKLVDEVPENAKILADRFWPGPLTMIMNKNSEVPYKVTAGLETVAIRLPNNKIARELIRLSGTCIAAPSANTSGKPSPTSAAHVIDDLYGKVDMIIDGGSCSVGLESSVVDVTVDIPMVLRPGGVTIEDIKNIFGAANYDPAIISSDSKIVPKSPGQKYRHYSPKAEVILFKGNIDKVVETINENARNLSYNKKVGIIATTQTKDKYNNEIVDCIGDRDNPVTIAANLFKALRELDKMGVDVILSETFDEDGIGKAIMNRLNKASSKTINC